MFWGCNGQSVGQLRKREYRQNVRKMSKKCLKNIPKLFGGAASKIFGHFLDNFWLFGRCFSVVTLSNARPLQFWGELLVIWKQWFETVPCRATLNTPFSALCPRILGTRFTKDAAFLLTVGSFLLTVELFYLQLAILASLLTIGAFLLTVLASLLTVEGFLLTVGSASKKGP